MGQDGILRAEWQSALPPPYWASAEGGIRENEIANSQDQLVDPPPEQGRCFFLLGEAEFGVISFPLQGWQ